ncbi:MAG: orotidine-5'-phosphate decarboxylase [Hyphomicrobium sp.]
MRDADRDKLIVALDVPTYDDARDLVLALGDTVNFYKIGLELLFAEGLTLARELKTEGKRVFLDLKFLDIGNTVERAVANAAVIGVDFLTVHGHDTKTLKAAIKGRKDAPLKLLAVTVLTSLDQTDLDEQGLATTPSELVLTRARMARAAGIEGVIASGQEAGAIRSALGPNFMIVTPGIRMASDDVGDQSRIMGPVEALRAGADHLVVGRPITAAADPKRAAQQFVAAIAAA